MSQTIEQMTGLDKLRELAKPFPDLLAVAENLLAAAEGIGRYRWASVDADDANQDTMVHFTNAVDRLSEAVILELEHHNAEGWEES